MFKMASSSDLFLLFKYTLNVIIQRQNLTQRFTEEVHLYQDLQLAHAARVFVMSSGRHLEYFKLLFLHVS